MFDILIKDALVVLPEEVKKVNIGISHGKISCILADDKIADSKNIYSFPGAIIFPGLIDSHSHVTYCGNVFDGSRTAAGGGITTLIEMPTSSWLPTLNNSAELSKRIDRILESSVVDFALWGGVSADNFENLCELDKKGIAGFKIFTCDAGTYGLFSEYDILCLMDRLKSFNGLLGIHAENESICTNLTRNYISSGMNAESFSQSRPIISEMVAVAQVCSLSLYTGTRIHICHISSSSVIEIAKQFKSLGAKISLETCPHYLLLTDEDTIRYGVYSKCSPPLRNEKTRNELWECFLRGDIDIIGSDHATYSENQKNGDSFWSAPGGFPGLDVLFSGIYEYGTKNYNMSLNLLAEMTSSRAAKTFGISYRKGSIEIGKDADLAIFDPQTEWIFRSINTYYTNKSDRYPYEGKKFKGKIISTFVRGEEVYSHGNILQTRGGMYIPSIH